MVFVKFTNLNNVNNISNTKESVRRADTKSKRNVGTEWKNGVDF